MDSGIRWDEDRQNLVEKYYLNRGELPVPGSEGGAATPAHDANGDGVFNVTDYAGDPRAVDDPDDDNDARRPGRPHPRRSATASTTTATATSTTSPGWDFFEGDNDPNDDVDYGHGTGESEDSAGEIGTEHRPAVPELHAPGDARRRQLHRRRQPLRRGDRLRHRQRRQRHPVGARHAQQHALRARPRSTTPTTTACCSSRRRPTRPPGTTTMPSALDHAMVVNSVTPAVETIQRPATWLALNGCTNFGGYIWVAVASTSCSSDAVGQTAGMAGLLYSAARQRRATSASSSPSPSGRATLGRGGQQLFRLARRRHRLLHAAGCPSACRTTSSRRCRCRRRYVTTARLGPDHRLGPVEHRRHGAAGRGRPHPAGGRHHLAAVVGTAAGARHGRRRGSGRGAAGRGVHLGGAGRRPACSRRSWPATETWTTVARRRRHRALRGHARHPRPRRGAPAHRHVGAALQRRSTTPRPRSLPEQDAFRIRVVVHADGDTASRGRRRSTSARPSPTTTRACCRAGRSLLGGRRRRLARVRRPRRRRPRRARASATATGEVHAFRADGTRGAGLAGDDRSARPPRPAATTPSPRGELAADRPRRGPDRRAGGRRPRRRRRRRGGRRPTSRASCTCGTTAGSRVDGLPGADAAAGSARRRPASEVARPELRRRRRRTTPATSSTPSTTASPRSPSPPTSIRRPPGSSSIAGANDGHVYAWHADGIAGGRLAGAAARPGQGRRRRPGDPPRHLRRRRQRALRAQGHRGAGGRRRRRRRRPRGRGQRQRGVRRAAEHPRPRPRRRSALVQDGGNTRTYLLHHDGTAHPATTAHGGDAAPRRPGVRRPGGRCRSPWPRSSCCRTSARARTARRCSADVDGDGTLEIVHGVDRQPAVRAAGRRHERASARRPTAATTPPARTVPGIGSLATDFPTFAALGGGALGRMGGAGSGVVLRHGRRRAAPAPRRRAARAAAARRGPHRRVGHRPPACSSPASRRR